MAPLLEALRAAGAEVVTDEGRPPLHITGHGLGGGLIRIDASASSSSRRHCFSSPRMPTTTLSWRWAVSTSSAMCASRSRQ